MKKKYLPSIFLNLFFCFNLEASIEAYFHKINNKSDSGRNQVEGIDFIYLINLDQRVEKFERSVSQLLDYGIRPYRFSAVNGWELSINTINNLGVRYEVGMPEDLMGTYYLPNDNFEPHHEILQVPEKTYFCHTLSRGAIGIVLSHLSILQDALNSGYETIWVLEDDINVVQNPHLLTNKIHELDELIGHDGWDILFTDIDTKNKNGDYIPCSAYAKRPNFFPKNPNKFAVKTKINDSFRKIGARYGAYSMIIRKSGIEKILSFIKTYKIFLPYDLDFIFPENMRMYTLNHDIVTTLTNPPSDNSNPNYLLNQKKAEKLSD